MRAWLWRRKPTFKKLGVLFALLAVYVAVRSFYPEPAFVVGASTEDISRRSPGIEFSRGPPTTNDVAVCLSGGGYRAALFDVGVLWRLNELGALGQTSQLSTVSGGSITGAYLLLHWRDLDLSCNAGVSPYFQKVIADPLFVATKVRIDAPAVLHRLVSLQSAAHYIAVAYDRLLFKGATLGQLQGPPDAPQLLINATDLDNGDLWTFGQDGISSPAWPTVSSELYDDRKLPLAVAVAASSAFPPVFAPLNLDVHALVPSPPTAVKLGIYYRGPADPPDADARKAQMESEREFKKRSHRIGLVDGGVLNNLGTEYCIGGGATIIADAALPPTITTPGPTWFHTIYRVLNLMYAVKEDTYRRAARQRTFPGAVANGLHFPYIIVALSQAPDLWRYGQFRARLGDMVKTASFSNSERTDVAGRWPVAASSADVLEDNAIRAMKIGSVGTGLAPIDNEEQHHLVNLGYLICDFAVLEEFVSSSQFRTMGPAPIPVHVPASIPRLLSAPLKLPYPPHHCLTDRNAHECSRLVGE
jgi:predicted acylesterase/phospholipase RssA